MTSVQRSNAGMTPPSHGGVQAHPRHPRTQAAPSTHPRRPPAHRSVSLLHSPRMKLSPNQSSDSSSDSGRPNKAHSGPGSNDAPSSLQPLGRHSSGDSSNADNWFEKSNNEVRENSASFVDNEPPFFMRNSSSSESPPRRQNKVLRLADFTTETGSLPMRTGLMQLGDDGSSTEDFRGVIDDLTIENKKLKRRLKKYEKLHDSHLKDEKLFEVRIHGLPAERKRELEETLRKFASGLGPRTSAQFPINGYEGLLLNAHKPGSSQASLQLADSAYASASVSGQGGSIGLPGSDSRYRSSRPSAASKRENIHTFLGNIPEGLLPQSNPATMTERAKKRLVANMMEQVFSGKGPNNASHQQPMQQQEVSQMAAKADRSALKAQGQLPRQEGRREALIMRQKRGSSEMESLDDSSNVPKLPAKVGEQDFAERSSSQSAIEQRPTRPLDLDPHRAQVPSDNIRYMRHLGFSPQSPEMAPEDGHGWIYLNLLINMAQLHTINVTTDFVRKALGECSNQFEISPDGRKVRWRPAPNFSGDSSGSNSNDRVSDDVADGQSPRKRPKLSHQRSSHSTMPGSVRTQGGATQWSRAESNKHVYTPMFFHKDDADEGDDSSSEEEDEASSPFPPPMAGDSSGMTSSGIRTIKMKKDKKNDNDGPIIFYNNARFCTDLSGERGPRGNLNAPPYSKNAMQAIGEVQAPRSVNQVMVEKRGPLAEAAQLPEPMDLHDNPIPKSMELTFPPTSPIESGPGKSPNPVDFEVTGIGGVYPADNFAINVESRHARVDQGAAPEVSQGVARRSLPPKFAQLLHGPDAIGKSRAAVHKQVLSSCRKDLPPSELPPALCYMPSGEELPEEDESDDDDDDEMSILPESPGAFPPSAAPQAMDLGYMATDEEGEEDDEEEDDDDDSDAESDYSLDLLAAARQADPEAVRVQEREYDANMAERLAEEVPVGSSAATAGGCASGFASPASGVARAEYRRAQTEAREAQRPVALKRARTSDSMLVQGLESTSGSEDGSDDLAGDDVSIVSS